MRLGRRAATAVIATVILAGCQTTSNEPPSGAVVGGVTGAAMGSTTGVGGSSLLGALVGVVAGAVIGSQVIDGPAKSFPPLTGADQSLADAAAGDAADAGIGQRIHWKSNTDDGVGGWSEAYSVDEPVPGRECREIRMYYSRGSEARVEAKNFCREGERWVRS